MTEAQFLAEIDMAIQEADDFSPHVSTAPTAEKLVAALARRGLVIVVERLDGN